MKGTLEWLGELVLRPSPALGQARPLAGREDAYLHFWHDVRHARRELLSRRRMSRNAGSRPRKGKGAPVDRDRQARADQARCLGGAAGVEMAGPERGPPAADRQQRHVDRHRKVADPGEDVGVASEIDRATAAYDEADRLRLGREAMPAPIVIGRSRADGDRTDLRRRAGRKLADVGVASSLDPAAGSKWRYNQYLGTEPAQRAGVRVVRVQMREQHGIYALYDVRRDWRGHPPERPEPAPEQGVR